MTERLSRMKAAGYITSGALFTGSTADLLLRSENVAQRYGSGDKTAIIELFTPIAAYILFTATVISDQFKKKIPGRHRRPSR